MRRAWFSAKIAFLALTIFFLSGLGPVGPSPQKTCAQIPKGCKPLNGLCYCDGPGGRGCFKQNGDPAGDCGTCWPYDDKPPAGEEVILE